MTQFLLDELETFGKLEANNWAHIPHVEIENAFRLDPETFQVLDVFQVQMF